MVLRNNPNLLRKPASMAVIIAAYNNRHLLEKTLWGYFEQDFKAVPVELFIADDGSSEDIPSLLEQYRPESPWPLRHIHQPDKGFRKCRILNKAILATEADYLVFTDQDCVPRKDFLTSHYKHAAWGCFLSGGFTRLPREISDTITRDDIRAGDAHRFSWLQSRGLRWQNFHFPKLIEGKWLANFANLATYTDTEWNGGASSCWREDALLVNGFDERMLYGYEDTEFGLRLVHAGIFPKQLRYSIACIHLDHDRPDEFVRMRKQNIVIMQETRQSRATKTEFGLQLDHSDDP